MPPYSATRSRMPTRPCPPFGVGHQAAPVVLHLDVEPVRARSAPAPAPRWRAACRTALVRPSCAIRYAARSTPGLSGTGSPSTRSAHLQVTRADLAHQPVELGEAGLRGERQRTRPRCAARRRAGASRPAPRARSPRPPRGRPPRAAWSGPSRRRTAWVWMVTTLIEWDTMSCSSRAIRVRSSAAALGCLELALALELRGPGDRLVGAGGPVLQQHADGPRADEEHHGRREVARLEGLDDRDDQERHHHEAEPEVVARRPGLRSRR